MIYSVSHQFIFVRNWKTAGSSLREVLRHYQPFYRKNRYLEYAVRKCEMLFPQKFRLLPVHVDARTIRDEIGHENFKNFFTFGFVRNPWDWQVSLYFFILKRKRHYLHRLISQFKTFDDYINWHVSDDKSKRLQKDFFSDADGKMIVDFIGKFENLDSDFQYILDKIGIQNKTIPHINKTKHRDFRSYYSDYSAQLIADFYKEDNDFFGYQF
jgi:hypothetical protein